MGSNPFTPKVRAVACLIRTEKLQLSPKYGYENQRRGMDCLGSQRRGLVLGDAYRADLHSSRCR